MLFRIVNWFDRFWSDLAYFLFLLFYFIYKQFVSLSCYNYYLLTICILYVKIEQMKMEKQSVVCVFLKTTSAWKYMYLYENFNLVQVLYQRANITTETDMR